jgi:ATP-dependent Clp protease ATP-binding subunit ClpA
LTKTVIFHNLTKENLRKIVELEIDKLQERLKSSKVKLQVSDSAKDLILDSCNLKFGGRDIARNVVRYVEEPICDYLLESEDDWMKKKIVIDCTEDKKINVSLK